MAQDKKELELVVVKDNNNKFGITNSEGSIVVKCEYDNITLLYGDKSKRYLLIRKGSLYGLYDSKKMSWAYECLAKRIRVNERKQLALAYEPRKLLGFIPWLSKTIKIPL